MRAFKIVILTAAAFAFLATIAGCGGGGGGEQFGESITLTETTSLSAILSDPSAYNGSTVRVEGEIQTECPSGCWFNLVDDAAVVRVDLAPHGIAIPQRVGSNVVIEGTVRVTDGQVVVLGQGVELR